MNKNEKTKYIAYISVKSYVCRWLIYHFGNIHNDDSTVISLKSDKYLESQFISRLQKKSQARDACYTTLKKYKSQIKIEIPKSIFFNYGWALTSSDCVSFNKLIENQVKSSFNQHVGMWYSLGFSVEHGIQHFRDKYGFQEDDWALESMRKEYYRHGCHSKLKSIDLFHQLSQEIFVKSCPKIGQLANTTNNE